MGHLTDFEKCFKGMRAAAGSDASGLLAKFAERHGKLTEKRIDEIIQSAFPKRYHEAVKDISKNYSLDLGCVSQMAVCAVNIHLRGSRNLALDANGQETVPANLFVHVTGDPCSKKSLLTGFFLGEITKRQMKEAKRHEKELKEYEKAQERSEWTKDQGSELPPKPDLSVFYATDTTIDVVKEHAKDSPEGTLWHTGFGGCHASLLDEICSQPDSGAAMMHLISGYNGKPVTVDRKNHDGASSSACARPFNLSLLSEVQTCFLKDPLYHKNESQAYLPHLTHIVMPPVRGGETGSIFGAGNILQDYAADYEYLDNILSSLLDLQGLETKDGWKAPLIHLNEEARAAFDKWHDEFSSSCGLGVLDPYVECFANQVLRIALGLHYLHLADKSVETGQSIEVLERIDSSRKPCLEKEDMDRAIAVADIFIKALDKFLWLWKGSEKGAREYLNSGEAAFVQAAVSNAGSNRKPRSVR